MFALLTSVALFDACSSSSGTTPRTPTTAAAKATNLVRWRQCLVRHGAKLAPVKKVKKAPFTRAQLLRALKTDKAFRVRFAAALAKTPPGVEATRYKAAVIACEQPGALAVRKAP